MKASLFSKHVPSSEPAPRGFVGLATLATLAVGLFASCGPMGFDPSTKIQSVRVLASRADKPYAKPGDAVSVELLTFDGRKNRVGTAKTYWLPIACINPIADAYFGCFAGLAGSERGARIQLVDRNGATVTTGDSGGANGGGGLLPSFLQPGTDVTRFLYEGPKFAFTVPTDIVSTHMTMPGAPQPYGLAIAFNITCPGQVRIAERGEGASKQQSPLICTDSEGQPLGPEDYVIGFTRVYAYDTLTNTNPVIEGITFNGEPVDLVKGISVEHCVPDDKDECKKHKIDVLVPPTSQEERPGESSEARREQVFATFYGTDGEFDGEGRTLYDVRLGKVNESAMDWKAPKAPGSLRMWVVVRDNRAGASWVEIPVTVN